MKKKVGVLTEADWQRLREEVRPILEEIVEKTRPAWVDSMLSTGDKAAGYFKKFDEEKTVMSGQISQNTDDIEEIDQRVKKIEQKFGFTSAA